MVLLGTQALFGFQLFAVFNERFKEFGKDEQLNHFSATVLVRIVIARIMTPTAFHRLAEQTTISKFFVWLASWLITAGPQHLPPPGRDARTIHHHRMNNSKQYPRPLPQK
jgi:hypothetical protein